MLDGEICELHIKLIMRYFYVRQYFDALQVALSKQDNVSVVLLLYRAEYVSVVISNKKIRTAICKTQSHVAPSMFLCLQKVLKRELKIKDNALIMLNLHITPKFCAHICNWNWAGKWGKKSEINIKSAYKVLYMYRNKAYSL